MLLCVHVNIYMGGCICVFVAMHNARKYSSRALIVFTCVSVCSLSRIRTPQAHRGGSTFHGQTCLMPVSQRRTSSKFQKIVFIVCALSTLPLFVPPLCGSRREVRATPLVRRTQCGAQGTACCFNYLLGLPAQTWSYVQLTRLQLRPNC